MNLEHTALVPLFDSRIENYAQELGSTFDLIVVSNNPLAYSGASLQCDDLASRIWVRGKAEFGHETTPSTEDLGLLLRALSVGVFESLHEKQESVLLHPGLFKPSELNGNDYAAPPACLALCSGQVVLKDLTIYKNLPGGTTSFPELGCLHTKSVSEYGQADLHLMWEEVEKRSRKHGGISADLKKCLKRSAEESHQVLCSWLHSVAESPDTPILRSTGIYCCPVSPVIATDSGRTDTMPDGVVGMSWITFVAQGEWDDRIQQMTDDFVRTMWFVLFSSHIAKRSQTDWQVAEEEGRTLGIGDSTRIFAHQIKEVGFGIGSGWIVDHTRWEAIQEFSKNAQFKLPDPKIVPVAELYHAVQATMWIWSLSYRPSDMFDEGRIPDHLAGLLARAFDLAKMNQLVSYSRNKNFNTDWEDVLKVNQHKLMLPGEFDSSSYHQLKSIRINKKYFEVDDSKETSLKELSALLRAIIVICENFLIHAQTKLSVSSEASNENIVIRFTNQHPQTEILDKSGSMHLGYRGLDLLARICSRELNGKVNSSEKGVDPFWVEIIIRRLDWLGGAI